MLRLGQIRTLRDLGVGLAAIRKVLAHEATIGEVAGAHAASLETQIRTLRLHQAVLRAVASRGTATPERFSSCTSSHSYQPPNGANEFIDDTFTGIDLGPNFLHMMRNAMPDLPSEPTQDQIDAWVELAELVQDPGFRASPPAGSSRTGPGPCGNPRRAQHWQPLAVINGWPTQPSVTPAAEWLIKALHATGVGQMA